jgi:hypothetical protein
MSDEARFIELCRLTAEYERLNIEYEKNLLALATMQAQGALIVHALDRALQLTEALMSFWPPAVPMHPNVSACKQQLDEAMASIHKGNQ